MKIKNIRISAFFILLGCTGLLIFSCKKETVQPDTGDGTISTYNPTPYTFNYFPASQNTLVPMPIPADNPTTVEGVSLGRKLFYDKILSSDGSLSCASCHNPYKAFSDSPNALTTVGGALEYRNTPAIMNLGWASHLFWDGRAWNTALEKQALEPVVMPNEMHSVSWDKVVQRLQSNAAYPSLFYKAFGTSTIDSTLVVKAIAQFERTLISDNSKFDKYLNNEVLLTAEEMAGYSIFMSEVGNCFHCHGGPGNPLWTDNSFHDTGLDATYTDLGLGAISGNASDNGKFKTPTLRNLLFTDPYMHDGRFQTLEEVIDFYSTGIKESPNLDPNFYRASQGGANFTQQQKDELIAFLKTLTDSSYITNPAYQAP